MLPEHTEFHTCDMGGTMLPDCSLGTPLPYCNTQTVMRTERKCLKTQADLVQEWLVIAVAVAVAVVIQ